MTPACRGADRMTDDTTLEVTGLIERIDAALATAPVKADPRERDRLERWRRELLLTLADNRRAEWGD